MKFIIATGCACLLNLAAVAYPLLEAPADVVVMIDRSGSTADGGDLDTQLEGYASALARDDVGDALAGMDARLSVVAWSGPGQQQLLIDRAATSGPLRAREVAAAIKGAGLVPGGLTDIGSAVEYAIGHLDQVADLRSCALVLIATDQLDAGGYAVAHAQRAVTSAHAARASALERDIIIHGFAMEHASVATYLRAHIATPGGEVALVLSAAELDAAVTRLLTADPCRVMIASAGAARTAS